jgi:hypothetical protein
MFNCCNCDPRGDYRFITDIQEYIHDEMKDSRYYSILAQQAPTQRAKDILTGFSQDEWMHARQLMNAYQMLTGQMYTPGVVEEPVIPEYNEALKVRVLNETSDYKKYGEKFLAACGPWLKDMFFLFRTDEGTHAMRMPILMSGG